MPCIWCYMDDCIYLKNNCCLANTVEIDDDCTCSTFEDYHETVEYKQEYYIAVRAIDGERARAKKLGKKITINGVDFYTESHPSCKDYETYLTHARTGTHCATVTHIKNNWKLFLKREAKEISVSELPLVEFDEKSRKYIYITDEAAGEPEPPAHEKP